MCSEKWKDYERLAYSIIGDEYDSNTFSIIPNARISGFISGRKRQIDILIDYRFESALNQRIIIDAKNKKRPIDIKEVEAFEGLMKDVSANSGILICSNGYTKAALRRAQQLISIRLIDKSKINDVHIESWDRCLFSKCFNGLVSWDAVPGIYEGNGEGPISINATGKCDQCGRFHVWCWDCGHRSALDFEDEFKCGCQNPWFWLTSIEDEEDIGFLYKSNYLLLVALSDVLIMDRRAM